MMKPTRFAASAALATAALMALSGCATTALDAQWSNPQQAAASLKGARVLVACEAVEPVVRQICQDKLAAELTTLGATVVKAGAPGGDAAADAASRHAAAARAAGAKAVFSVSVTPDLVDDGRSGMSVGFGLGSGFGIGRGGFGGVGIGVPIGGSRVSDGYAGNGSLLEAESGVLLWTAKTRSRSVDAIQSQIEYLTRALAEGAQKAGYF